VIGWRIVGIPQLGPIRALRRSDTPSDEYRTGRKAEGSQPIFNLSPIQCLVSTVHHALRTSHYALCTLHYAVRR